MEGPTEHFLGTGVHMVHMCLPRTPNGGFLYTPAQCGPSYEKLLYLPVPRKTYWRSYKAGLSTNAGNIEERAC